MPPVSRLSQLEEMFTKQLEEVVTKRPLVLAVVVALIVGGGAYWFGSSSGYNKGQTQAQTDAQNVQAEAAKKAAAAVTKSANPFQAVNPLKGVTANPFDKVKKVLNPFQK